MTCGNIRFGADNHVENSAIASTPEVDNELSYLASYHPSQQSIFSVDDQPIVINGTSDKDVTAEYFMLVGSNLSKDASLKLELFAGTTGYVDLLNMDDLAIGLFKPIGEWIVGVDPYNVPYKSRGESPLALWFDAPIKYRRWRLTIAHGYAAPAIPEYNQIPTQDEFGVISLEAESGVVTARGNSTWSTVSDNTASGGHCLFKTGGGFSPVANTGSKFSFSFAATQTGTHKIWVRAKSIAPTGNDSFHVTVDKASSTYQAAPRDGAWHWIHAHTAQLSGDHSLVISAREENIYIDKIVILPNAAPAPTGTGPAASEFGEIGAELSTVRLGYLRIGSTWQPENNYSWGYKYSTMTRAKSAIASNGKPVLLEPKKKAKSIVLPFDAMTENDTYHFIKMEEERAGRPVYVMAHPGHTGWVEDATSFLGSVVEPGEYTHNFIDRQSQVLSIKEV